LRIVYIEDRSKDAETYRDLLGKRQRVEIYTLEPSPKLDVAGIVDKKPDLVLLDYELTRKLSSGLKASYQGGTLATRLREELRDHPLILFTRRTILQQYAWPSEELGAVDEIIYKEDVDQDPEGGIRILRAIAKGFATLRSVDTKDWDSLVEALRARPSEVDLLREASPPLGLRADKKGREIVWSVREAAAWILKTLFAFPGLLYDSLYASASLGIDEDSFLKTAVQRYFKEAEYDGPFSGVSSRWWRRRLHENAFRCIRRARLPPVLTRSFRSAFQKMTGTRIEPSRCATCGAKSADSVCYVLRKPVERRCSLEYFPDKRPPVMDVARVSFKAIREDNRVQDELFSNAGQKLLRGIRISAKP
jgi:CheY-like chemotaxis protein